jgi:hypothetical protein
MKISWYYAKQNITIMVVFVIKGLDKEEEMTAYRSSKPIPSSEITPEHVYLNRRKFMQGAGLASAAALLAACTPNSETPSEAGAPAGQANPEGQPAPGDQVPPTGSLTDELGDPANSYQEITNYNNYYEFTTDKQGQRFFRHPLGSQSGRVSQQTHHL